MATTSALLRSAASVRNQLATYQDQLMAYEYSNSAYTDSAYSTYANYLRSRIGSLNAAPSVSNMSKALSLTKALNSATKSNISATIQRENIQVLSGNATLTDKYNVIAQQFQRAYANGDLTLAQTLEGQAYSLSQSIQLQQQTAANAQATLAKANATSEGDIVTNLSSALDQLNTTLKHTGQKDFNATIANWVAANKATFNALGVDIPKGAQPNYWNIVNGVMGAMYNHDMLAYQALVGTDPYAAQQYKDRAVALYDGQSTVKTLAGDRNAQQVQEAMANPSMFIYDQNTGTFIPSTQQGLRYNPASPLSPQATYTGKVTQPIILNTTQTMMMTTMGLIFSEKPNSTPGNGVRVQASDKSPQWLQKILGPNGVTNMFTDGNGGLQFQADSVSGPGKAVYTVAKDGTAWESSALGDKLLSGIPQLQQSNPTSVFGQIGAAFMSGMKDVANLVSPTAYADALPSNLLARSANNFNNIPSLPPLPGIPVALPNELPRLTMAQPTSQPALKVAPAIAPAIAPATVSPQSTAGSARLQPATQGSALQVANGGMSLQGGGSGGGFSLQ